MFQIEEQHHAEWLPGQCATRAEALDVLRGLALIAWDAEPNKTPCQSWRTCGRCYEIAEHDVAVSPWLEISRETALEVDRHGARWALPRCA